MEAREKELEARLLEQTKAFEAAENEREQERAQFTEQIVALSNQVAELQEGYDAERSAKQENEQAVVRMRDQVQELQTLRSSASESLAALESERARAVELAAALGEASRRSHELEQQLSEATSAEQSSRNVMHQVEARIAEAEAGMVQETSSLQAELVSAVERAQKSQELTDRLQADMEAREQAAQALLQAASTERARVEHDNAALTRSVHELRNELLKSKELHERKDTDVDARVRSAEHERDQWKNRFQSLERANGELMQNGESAEREMSKLRERIAKLEIEAHPEPSLQLVMSTVARVACSPETQDVFRRTASSALSTMRGTVIPMARHAVKKMIAMVSNAQHEKDGASPIRTPATLTEDHP